MSQMGGKRPLVTYASLAEYSSMRKCTSGVAMGPAFPVERYTRPRRALVAKSLVQRELARSTVNTDHQDARFQRFFSAADNNPLAIRR